MTEVTKFKHESMHTQKKSGNRPLVVQEHLNTIDVNIVGAPTIEQFRKTISVFMMNTWNDRIETEFSDKDIDTCISELFAGNILPTGMETINITFSVEGMNLVDTTHLIRHRLGSFSAQTHADRDLRDDRVLVPAGILADTGLNERFMQIMNLANELYCDSIDSGKLNCLDARLVMPRCLDHFYIVRFTIKDLIAFCRMRGDEQIQTQADNIIAMKLWLEVLKLYPFLAGLIDFRAPDSFYVKQCRKGKTNIFPPNEKNDNFPWVKDMFVHDRHRDDFPGGEVYLAIRQQLLDEIDEYII